MRHTRGQAEQGGHSGGGTHCALCSVLCNCCVCLCVLLCCCLLLLCPCACAQVNQSILETTLTHSVQTRFRVDEKKRIPYARTEHNLFDILESDSLHQRFRKYGVVKPWTKTAKEMKRGYEQQGAANADATQAAANGGDAAATTAKEGEAAATTQATPAEPQVAESAEPAAPVSATTTDPAAATDAAAAAVDGSAPASDSAATPAAAAPSFTPFRPTGSLPLALQFNHPHLALSSLKSLHNLVGIDSSAGIHAEIKATLESFLEEYLDEALMMFHKDVPQLKQKLCVEITEACKPARPRTKKQKLEESGVGAKKQETKTETASSQPADAVKDEL